MQAPVKPRAIREHPALVSLPPSDLVAIIQPQRDTRMTAQNIRLDGPLAITENASGVMTTAAMPIPDVLRGLEAIVVALITRQGALKDANRGFLLLMTRCSPAPEPGDVRDLFSSPRFADIISRPKDPFEGAIYRGLFSLGSPGAKLASLRGSIYLHDADYLLVAEHDIVRLETLRMTLLELQDDLAEKQRHIVHLEHRVSRLQELADAAMRDRDTLLDALAHRGRTLPE
jgi:hypothetical protein